jgi:hypothetical protein
LGFFFVPRVGHCSFFWPYPRAFAQKKWKFTNARGLSRGGDGRSWNWLMHNWDRYLSHNCDRYVMGPNSYMLQICDRYFRTYILQIFYRTVTYICHIYVSLVTFIQYIHIELAFTYFHFCCPAKLYRKAKNYLPNKIAWRANRDLIRENFRCNFKQAASGSQLFK